MADKTNIKTTISKAFSEKGNGVSVSVTSHTKALQVLVS